MAEKKPQDMSIEEMLAAARANKPAGNPTGQAKTEPANTTEEPAQAEPAPKQPVKKEPAKQAAPTQPAKAPGAMSVEEMLAAARAEKAAKAQSAATGDKSGSTAEKSPATGEKSASPGTKSASPAKAAAMSVEEMLAAARAEKAAKAAASQAAAAVTKPAEEAKPAPAAKTPPKAPAKAKTEAEAEPKETASVLAEARKSAKPGPISKAEAAQREQAEGKRPAVEKKKLEAPPMPSKPAYAQRPAPQEATEDRRGFFASFTTVLVGSALAMGFSSLAVTHLLWVLGLARFMFPNILIEPPTKFKVGFKDDLSGGQVQEKFKAQFGVWIVRHEYEGQTQIYALKTVCTHLGCTPNWLEGEQKFKCPCHGSGFYKDGVNFEGPAPRPLERYAIREADDGQLEVDKSRTFLEEKGDWNNPDCFVRV